MHSEHVTKTRTKWALHLKLSESGCALMVSDLRVEEELLKFDLTAALASASLAFFRRALQMSRSRRRFSSSRLSFCTRKKNDSFRNNREEQTCSKPAANLCNTSSPWRPPAASTSLWLWVQDLCFDHHFNFTDILSLLYLYVRYIFFFLSASRFILVSTFSYVLLSFPAFPFPVTLFFCGKSHEVRENVKENWSGQRKGEVCCSESLTALIDIQRYDIITNHNMILLRFLTFWDLLRFPISANYKLNFVSISICKSKFSLQVCLRSSCMPTLSLKPTHLLLQLCKVQLQF